MKELLITCILLTLVYCQEPRCHRWNSGGTSPYVSLMTADKMCLKLKPRNYILPRMQPGSVGDVKILNLVPGKRHMRITKARKPPVFEIPDFLSDEECSHVINVARKGLRTAMMMGKNGRFIEQKGWHGKTAFIRAESDPVLVALKERAAALTGMPMDIMEESELFQVGYYGVGGYYHSHYDSSETPSSDMNTKPCCHNTHFPHSRAKCIVCRYITVLMYLNDVEEGGETAFPVADTPPNTIITNKHINLSEYCHQASVVVKPKKGKAIMWYNNYRDPKTGWIGGFDPHSLHGGCPVVVGEKWISNIWISAPQYSYRNSNSIYTDRWT